MPAPSGVELHPIHIGIAAKSAFDVLDQRAAHVARHALEQQAGLGLLEAEGGRFGVGTEHGLHRLLGAAQGEAAQLLGPLVGAAAAVPPGWSPRQVSEPWVMMAFTSLPPVSLMLTSVFTVPLITPEAVPASWLRALRRMPAASVCTSCSAFS